MKTLSLFGLAVALALTVSVSRATAEDMTLKGDVMCAKCTLKKADAKQCQDVLVVKDDAGEAVEYYVTKNAVAEKFGHNCQGQTSASVTGSVLEKDGKKWITPSKMEKAG